MKYQIYRDAKKEYRWRLLATNGKTIADSGEGYSSKTACERGIELVKSSQYAETEERQPNVKLLMGVLKELARRKKLQ